MRKALIAAAVATALFAVGAFAASFTVRSEDAASGSNPVTNCAASATVDFNESFDNASHNWIVNSATVTLASASSCEGGDVELVLQNSANGVIAGGPFLLADIDEADANVDFDAPIAGSVQLTFTLPSVPVGNIWNAAVLIDELQITTT
jgi:hypothetical protein